ncbi:MAG: CPBP family intramembrane metalloprotease [Thermosediminibacteraceae bacterium]|nr:CPBP family intramembrane metalloprotease [Thermosediminibacteraceae bacterium]
MTKKSKLFITLTLIISWLYAGIIYLAGVKWNTVPAVIAAVGYMYIPAIITIIVQKVIFKEPVMETLGVSFKLNRWFLVAWLLPPLLAFATIGISVLLPGVEFSPEMTGLIERFKQVLPPEQVSLMEESLKENPSRILLMALVQGLIAGISVNALAAFGEELGWRGLLFKETRAMGFWKSSAIIGAVWGIWHWPLIIQGHNYPEHPVAGVLMMVIFCILLSPIFNMVREKSGSVVAAAVVHGSLNGTAGIALMLVRGGSDLLVGLTGLAGFIVLGVVNAIIYLGSRHVRKLPANSLSEE